MPKPKPKHNKGKGKKKPGRGSKHTQTPNPPDNNQGRDPVYNDVASQAGSVTEPPNVTEVTVIQGYEQFALTHRGKSNSSNIATPSIVIADSTDDVGSPNTGASSHDEEDSFMTQPKQESSPSTPGGNDRSSSTVNQMNDDTEAFNEPSQSAECQSQVSSSHSRLRQAQDHHSSLAEPDSSKGRAINAQPIESMTSLSTKKPAGHGADRDGIGGASNPDIVGEGQDGDQEMTMDIPLNWLTGTSHTGSLFYAKHCRKTAFPDSLCTLCLRRGGSFCASCKARYCGDTCRRSDWRVHKGVCSQFKSLGPNDRPSDEHFLAMVLPTAKTTPDLVWCRMIEDCHKLEISHPDILDLAGDGDGGQPIIGNTTHVNNSKGTGGAFLGHGLAMVDVFGLKSSMHRGLVNINSCIHALTAPGALRFHMGPWVVFAFEPDDTGKPKKGIDVVPRDWRHIADYLIFDPSNPFLREVPRVPLQVLYGTKLSDVTNPALSLVSSIEGEIENVYVPIFDWPYTGPSTLPFQLGLPWKTRYIRAAPAAKPQPHMRYLKQYFRREYGADSSRWSSTEDNNCVTMIVLAIGKDRVVHKEHVVAFNKYLDFSLKRKIVPSRDGFMDYWQKHRRVLLLRDNVNYLDTPYHGPPRFEELVRYDGEDERYRKAMMNLLGYFASKGWKMAVREENGVLVPDDVVAPFDVEGDWEFTEDLKVKTELPYQT
ncbi:hypothetical protein SAPIO_CDS2176 [Scedosporium apiospermum]|uniref:MYND-type domain-containing protein n=1 Tax=Pseudallescheria apiosperma TaxID=563466 RepID=A0A084GDE6_PSEDA|nr:uncharacterized protein SAPIO_CDS2176 [Scedosporium apiospermum]KEZ45358.1 hypothetical protein SAPIO_CDS2176 [Scedosporium apiospermum]